MTHEPFWRLGFFFGVLAIMALSERRAPRRPLSLSKPKRWLSNLGLVVVDTIVVRLLVPATAIGMAAFVTRQGWGILNRWFLPDWVRIVAAVIALDFVIYLQHVMFHSLPVLWRFHMIHHADQDIDVTTGLRFHPVEILISMGIKIGAIVLIGATPAGVLIFEILLNACAMFNHSNVKLPLEVDRWLRLLLVTPDQHRVHHSVLRPETNSNYGFNLPWWDRLCGTYRAQPAAGHEGMTIGLNQFRTPEVARLSWILHIPFTGKTGEYPINAGEPQA